MFVSELFGVPDPAACRDAGTPRLYFVRLPNKVRCPVAGCQVRRSDDLFRPRRTARRPVDQLPFRPPIHSAWPSRPKTKSGNVFVRVGLVRIGFFEGPCLARPPFPSRAARASAATNHTAYARYTAKPTGPSFRFRSRQGVLQRGRTLCRRLLVRTGAIDSGTRRPDPGRFRRRRRVGTRRRRTARVVEGLSGSRLERSRGLGSGRELRARRRSGSRSPSESPS